MKNCQFPHHSLEVTIPYIPQGQHSPLLQSSILDFLRAKITYIRIPRCGNWFCQIPEGCSIPLLAHLPNLLCPQKAIATLCCFPFILIWRHSPSTCPNLEKAHWSPVVADVWLSRSLVTILDHLNIFSIHCSGMPDFLLWQELLFFNQYPSLFPIPLFSWDWKVWLSDDRLTFLIIGYSMFEQ